MLSPSKDCSGSNGHPFKVALLSHNLSGGPEVKSVSIFFPFVDCV